MMARHTVLLPEPDSPTSPSVWPWRIVTLTLFTAGEPGAVFGKTTVRSLIRNSSSGKSCKVGVSCMVLQLPCNHGAEVVSGESPVFGDEHDVAHGADVVDRVAVDQQQVGALAHFDRPEFVLQTEVLR